MYTDKAKLSEFDKIISLQTIEELDNEGALDHISLLIDLAHDLERMDGTDKALELCDQLGLRQLTSVETTLLHYFRANAWNNNRHIKNQNFAEIWSWEQPELEKELFYLRSAVVIELGFESLDDTRKCQIFTNLGNAMMTLGRFIEAVEYWNKALALIPNFGMALGNRGNLLSYYARMLYDLDHAGIFFKFSHDDLSAALASKAFYENPDYLMARAGFEKEKIQIEAHIDLESVTQHLNLNGYSLGQSEDERQYRRWCLSNCLFLNPLNDLGPFPIAAQDILSSPSYLVCAGEPPYFTGFFNQIKQEFVSARFIYYEGINTKGDHFSDCDVLLYDTLNHPTYSLAIEKIKAAYRILYSLFDKIAYFLNNYLSLGIKPNKVNFRTVWYENYTKEFQQLREQFVAYENWPLRGLFWLSKDLFDKESGRQNTIEPEAQKLWDIRNYLEHRYLQVHSHLKLITLPTDHDNIYPIGCQEFFSKTLRLLKLTRVALIYLSLGMHRQECLKLKDIDHNKIAQIQLQPLKR